MTDTDSLAALRARHGPRYRWLLMLSVMVGAMASIMSSTVVNVAIPDMSHHYGIALFGSTYLLPVFMQLGLELSASNVGTILLPSGIVLAFTIGLTGRLTRRVPIKVMVGGGLVLLAASLALMPTVNLGSPLWLLVVARRPPRRPAGSIIGLCASCSE